MISESSSPLKRTLKLKKNLLSNKYELCIERIRYFTAIYKKFPNDPEIIKRAKAVSHTLENLTIFIRDDELLVGNETSKNLGENIHLDLRSYRNSLDKKRTFKKFARRNPQPFFIDEEDRIELSKLIPFWKGKSLEGSRINKKLLKEGLISGIGDVTSLAPNISMHQGTTEGFYPPFCLKIPTICPIISKSSKLIIFYRIGYYFYSYPNIVTLEIYFVLLILFELYYLEALGVHFLKEFLIS